MQPHALLCPLLAFAISIVACSSSDRRPPPADPQNDIDLTDLTQYDRSTGDSRDIFQYGGCNVGETQQCRIYLPSHNDIQPCFVGEQQCTDGEWGQCGNAVLVDADNEDAELDESALSAP
jgi:hypothetical protein